MSDPALEMVPGTEAASRFQCDLYRYWRAVRQLGALRLGAHRYLTRAALRQLHALLDSATDDAASQPDGMELANLRLFFVRRTLERLGLLRRDAERGLVPGPLSEVERFFALPLEERLALLVKLWLAGGWWVERPDEHQEPPGLRAPAHPSVAVGRRQALQALWEAAPDDLLWLDRIAVREEPAEARRQPQTRAGIHMHDRAAPPAQADTLVSALLGPLCWLGLAVRADQPNTLRGAPALRVTAALDTFRPRTPEQPGQTLVEAAGRVLMGADFDVLAYPPLTARTLLTLDTCADPVGSGVAARYRLSRASLVRARRAGWPAGEVAQRLTALAGELPQNVRVTLHDWERLADRVRVRTDLAVLRVRTSRLLDALLADGAAGRAVVRRLSPTSALILDEHVGAVWLWLIRRGELPALSPPAE